MPLTVADILSPDGPLAKSLGVALEARPQQVTMARAVERALETSTHLLVEAGTGVGKSFAYLVPAMLRCLHHGERVVIATHTIALQEQLLEKDVPVLARALESQAPARASVRPLLVKGRGNYVSVRRLELASQRQDRLFGDPAARRSLHVIEDWAYSTRDGTLSTLPMLERAGVWDKVQSDSGNCMGKRCPRHEVCFYQRARAQLDEANLLICNHALFFSDLALRSQEAGFLPEYQHVILDEAHAVEDVASEHFGLSLSEGRVTHLLSSLWQPRAGKGYLAHLPLLTGDSEPVSRAVRLVEEAAGAARDFFDAVRGLTRGDERADWTRGGEGGRGEASSVRVREAGAVENVLTPAMRELSLRLKGLREGVKDEADRYELNAYAQRAELIAGDAEALVSQAMPGYAYWAETAPGGEGPRGRRAELACAPVDVGPLLRERLFRTGASVVLTSATLTTRTASADDAPEKAEAAFSHALERLGATGAATLQLGSPFDFARQVRFIVDPPTVGEDDPPGLTPLAATILRHVRATGGGAFVLFTSYASLNAAASELAGPMAEAGYPLLAQGRDGSRATILQRFRESDRAVLLGAASFWQGVDVRGDTLRNVIITKLPFEPPDRPLTQARAERLEAAGGNPFMEDSLPRAIIRFKQGFGRLIRSATDTGRVVVLDPRLLTARYGRLFLAALPPGVRVERGGGLDA